jgi:hypothetical protein
MSRNDFTERRGSEPHENDRIQFYFSTIIKSNGYFDRMPRILSDIYSDI